VITDMRIMTAPAGSGGTGSVRLPAGAAFAVGTAGVRPWTRGTGLPCAGLLGRPAGLEGRALPAVVPAPYVPATDVPATEPNSRQMFAGSPTTGTQQMVTQQIDTQPIDTQPIDTQHIGTTLGIHSPGRPQS
jgi:hypothetical protein